MARFSRWPLVAGPFLLLLTGALIALALLVAPIDTDGTYSCDGNAISTIISPEPDNPAIRAVAFDDAAACNQTARDRGWLAAGIVGVFGLASGAWVLVRHRAGTYS